MMDSELALFGPWWPGLWSQNWTGRNVYYDTHLILDRVRREIALAIRTRTVRMRNMRPIVSLFIR
jgi:hypothetical protein